MSNAPVCHISTGSAAVPQPRATLLPSIGTPVDLPSAIAVINQLKLIVQMLAGQQAVTGPAGINGAAGVAGSFGGGGAAGAAGSAGSPGSAGKKGKDGAGPPRFREDTSQRITKKKRIFQDNDEDSENWVDIKQINRVVWVDSVTGETIKWERGSEDS